MYGGDGSTGSNGLTGGVGQAGGDGTDGGTGGAGGAGYGGSAAVTAAAGNGQLTIDYVYASAVGGGGYGGDGGDGGYGGVGGDGGIGSTGLGGTGGRGGNGGNGGFGGAGGLAVGGVVTIGTESAAPQATASNLGLATFGTIYADATAYGGHGGSGGFAGGAGGGGAAGAGTPAGASGASGFNGIDGNGGDGGSAAGGAALLLVRGSTVDVDNAYLYGDANGGDGGFGGGEFGLQGNGGDATVGGDGGILVLVTERYQLPDQRGTLNAGTIIGSAVADGGSGWFDGASQTLGHNLIIFRNADGDIGSLNFTVAADGIGPGAVEDALSVKNGDVTVSGSLSFITDSSLSLFADNGSMTAGSLTLSAWDFVPNTVDVTPVVIGTYFADSATITTENNFLTTADLDIGSDLVIDAPGFIQAHNFTIDGNLDLLANGGDLNANDFDVNGYINLFAAGSINVNEIGAGSFVDIELQDGSTSFANINAGSFVSVVAGGSISGNDITTPASIFAQTFAGNVNLNNLTSTFGTVTVDAAGDIFLAGDVLADGDIDLTATGDILMHNATTHQAIDIDGGGYVDGDDLTAGDTIEVAAGQSVTLGNLSAGLVNPSFNFDAEYTVGILAGGAIFTGNIEAAQSIGLATPGTITTGNIDAGNIFMALGTGDMNFGDANAGGEIYLADFSMMALGGTVTDSFDPQPILDAVPVRTGGIDYHWRRHGEQIHRRRRHQPDHRNHQLG